MSKFKFHLRRISFFFLYISIQFQLITPFRLEEKTHISLRNSSHTMQLKSNIIDLNIIENKNLHYSTQQMPTTTTILNSKMIQEELMDNSWDYMTELILIVLLAILTVPSNIFLFLFYCKKVKDYKKLKNLSFTRYASITNSFHTYLIEMCAFDTIIVAYLVLNTTFQFLFYLKKSHYESVFDISNFTCKFFIYILRISGAMSNYLVFLLSLNRGLLIFFKYEEPHHFDSHRLCLNTKYLTLFLFCICTIANVFRLELLNINSSTIQNQQANLNNLYALFQRESMQNSENTTMNINELTTMIQDKGSECGPNLGSIVYTMGDSTNGLFWSIIIYNLIFAIAPALGNGVLSVYLISKRCELKKKLDLVILNRQSYTSDSNGTSTNQGNLDEIVLVDNKKSCASIALPRPFQLFYEDGEKLNDYIKLLNMKNKLEQKKSEDRKKKKKETKEMSERNAKNEMELSEFHIEFLKTCTPCIAFSLTHVILFLPYSIIELINQIRPYMTFMIILQYMTYVRYLFYCCKFYLLLVVSYKFRKEFKAFLNMSAHDSSDSMDKEVINSKSKFKISTEITCNKNFFTYSKNRRLFVLNCLLCHKNEDNVNKCMV